MARLWTPPWYRAAEAWWLKAGRVAVSLGLAGLAAVSIILLVGVWSGSKRWLAAGAAWIVYMLMP